MRRLDLIHARYYSMLRARSAVVVKVTVKHMPEVMGLRQACSAQKDRLAERAEESRICNQGSLKSPHLTFRLT